MSSGVTSMAAEIERLRARLSLAERSINEFKADRADIIEECARVYGEYIRLLEMENQSLTAIAYTHGIQCPDELVKRGEECRAAIRALKDKP